MEIKRYRGDTTADKFLISVNGSITDLTGCTVVLTVNSVKNPVNTDTQLYQIIGTVNSPTSGIVEFFPLTTDVDRVGYFYYDIQLTDATGLKHTIVKDSYIYLQDINKN